MNKNICILFLSLFFSLSCSKSDLKNEKARLYELFKSESQNFLRAEELRDFNFPRDHYKHAGFKTEWWYFTGNLDSGDKHFGYQLTLFRNSLDEKSENDIWMGHLGLSDVNRTKFYSFERFQDESMSLAGALEEPLSIFLEDWQIDYRDERFFIRAFQDEIGFDLELKPSKKIILQGNKGLSQKSSEKGNASYYYSITRLETRGKVQVENQTFEVKGESWFDREWSTSSLSENQEGWDWFAIQLSDNEEIMLYQLRNNDGTIGEFSYLAYIDKYSNKTNYAFNDFELKPIEYSDIQGSKYPSKWNLKLNDKGLDLEIEAYFKNQVHDFITRYWEGAIKVSGRKNEKRINGRGYLEMTGY